MKKVGYLILMLICLWNLVGCGEETSDEETSKEVNVVAKLQERAREQAIEIDKRVSITRGMEGAVRVEAVFQYVDIYDNYWKMDWAYLYCKYLLEDGSVVYLRMKYSDIKDYMELSDMPIFTSPSEEQAAVYEEQRSLATTGTMPEGGDYICKEVEEGVFVYEVPDKTEGHYYFLIK